MEAVTEQFPREQERQETRPRPIEQPSLEDVMAYSVEIDFSRASCNPGRLSELVEEARDSLRNRNGKGISDVIQEVEKINLQDAQGLMALGLLLADTYMNTGYTYTGRSCGIDGHVFKANEPNTLGVTHILTRVKAGQNTLAKVGRYGKIEEKYARRIIAGDESSYAVDHEQRTAVYHMEDLAAGRILFADPDLPEGMDDEESREYKADYLRSKAGQVVESLRRNSELVFLDMEEKYNPDTGYQAVHLRLKTRNDGFSFVREVQLLLKSAHDKSKKDNHHNAEKNDLMQLIR
jgi:hypothetical protein